MGTLDFENDKRILNKIKSVLKRRALVMDPEDEWEIHGPHQDMDYQVLVGPVYEKLNHTIPCNCTQGYHKCQKHRDRLYVVIYPRGVYYINDPDDWWKKNQKDRVSVVDSQANRYFS
jgi:hypothetical protein